MSEDARRYALGVIESHIPPLERKLQIPRDTGVGTGSADVPRLLEPVRTSVCADAPGIVRMNISERYAVEPRDNASAPKRHVPLVRATMPGETTLAFLRALRRQPGLMFWFRWNKLPGS